MCNPDCTCISCTVVFGQQLASLFHMWKALTIKSFTFLDRTVYDIEVSTSALRQLNDLLEQERTSPIQIFTSAGHQEIDTLALKCNLIFKAVILCIHNTAENTTRNSNDGPSKVLPCIEGDSDMSEQARTKNEDTEQGEKEDDNNTGLLDGPVPSLTSPKTLGLVDKIGAKWEWLGIRVTCCQIQLQWVKKSLLLLVQMGRLTCLANQGSTDVNGNYQSQFLLRGSVIVLRQNQHKCVKYRARKQERAEKLAQRRREAREERGNASLHSLNSRGTTSTVVLKDNLTNKNSNEKLTSPILWRTPAAMAIDPVQATGQPDLGAAVETNAPAAKKTMSGKLSSSFNELSLKLFDTMLKWTHKIFGKEDEFLKDWESPELEAWVFRPNRPTTRPIKVPFGHQRLQYGLKVVNRTKSKKLGLTTFARYIDGGPRMQVLIDEMFRDANRFDRRERACLAFESYKRQDTGGDPFTIVFFSIGEKKAPISFHDCIGRKMTLPFESCQTWEGMRIHIMEAFNSVPDIGPHVLEGHYSLKDMENDEHILPGLWDDTIKPGASIIMSMWPNLETHHPLQRPYGAPPFGPDPRQVAENSAQSGRYLRLQSVLISTQPLTSSPFRPDTGPPSRPMVSQSGGPPRQIMRPAKSSPGVSIAQGSRPGWTASSIQTMDENEMTEAEEKELTFVNFVELHETTKILTATDVLAKYTHLHDVSGQECMDEWDTDDYRGNESDSGSSSSSTSGSSEFSFRT